MKIKIIIILILFFAYSFQYVYAQQNYIFNYDFEFYTQCPVTLGQVNRCMGFFSLVDDADYSNCSFDMTDIYPSSDSTAYSGTGYVTMASHGNPNGYAESIGQNLWVPLDSGLVYEFFAVTKKSDSAQYSQSCGGINLYAFADTIYGPHLVICTASLPGATWLGTTDTVNNVTWSLKSFTFTAPFQVKAIAMSPACAPSCFQAIFLDSIGIVPAIVSTGDLYDENSVNVYPVPADNEINIYMRNDFNINSVALFKSTGEMVLSEKFVTNLTINTKELAAGFYILKLSRAKGDYFKKIFVRH